MIKNNNFHNDSDSMLSERLGTLSSHIDSYAAIFGFDPAYVAKLKAYAENFHKAGFEKTSAHGHMRGTAVWAAELTAKLKKQYQRCRTLIGGEVEIAAPETADFLVKRFNIGQRLPNRRDSIIAAAQKILAGFQELPTQHPEIVVPSAPFDDLADILAQLVDTQKELDKYTSIGKERTAQKKQLREECKNALRRVFSRARSIWDVNDPHFLELGMLPKSMIWTAHRPPTPGHVEFDPETRKLCWGGIEGIDSYEAEWRASDSRKGDHWTSFYDGEADRCTVPDDLHAVDVRVRAIAGGKESHWSKVIQIAD